MNKNTIYCANCGSLYINYCPKCDFAKKAADGVSLKNGKITILLCILLGFWGMHRFYRKIFVLGF